jgi:hypothetical protein
MPGRANGSRECAPDGANPESRNLDVAAGFRVRAKTRAPE